MSHVFFPSNHVLVAFVQGLHSLCHGWVMKDTQKTIGDFGTLNEVPSDTHHHPNIHGEAHSWIKFGKGLTFSLQRSNKIQGLFCCMTSVTSRISSSSVTYYKEPSNDEMTLILSTLQGWERKLSAQLSASVLYRTGILLSSSGNKVPRTNSEPLTLKSKGLKF